MLMWYIYSCQLRIRTIRRQKSLAFVEVNDGSSRQNLQAVCDGAILKHAERRLGKEREDYEMEEGLKPETESSSFEKTISSLSTGASVCIIGIIKVCLVHRWAKWFHLMSSCRDPWVAMVFFWSLNTDLGFSRQAAAVRIDCESNYSCWLLRKWLSAPEKETQLGVSAEYRSS